ncbi:bacteriophage spanin2 family protein [Actinokineospora sp.]|uniref:bacteriophage spanin2 family protein n=1 Tax=Actinokineospora sp. TaxID=1872133 RepID=UPI0040376102
MRSRLATVLAAAALVGGLTGCESVREATSAANAATDQASICLEAVKLAGFYPDLSNPEQAAKDAEQTAADLSTLAEKAADTTLRQALTDMSEKVGELGPGNLDPSNVARWANDKVSAVDALSQACL